MEEVRRSWIAQTWAFLKEDSWPSWMVSLVLMYVVIRFLFFPLLAFGFATPLPLVVVESCSMYHEQSFEGWWSQNSLWYQTEVNLSRESFEGFPFRNGLNKGDIIFVSGRGTYEQGDVIIFNANYTYPIIHRIVERDPLSTKGDHNYDRLPAEHEIPEDAVLGKAVARIPLLGWVKLIFFEGFKPSESRGFCR